MRERDVPLVCGQVPWYAKRWPASREHTHASRRIHCQTTKLQKKEKKNQITKIFSSIQHISNMKNIINLLIYI